MKQDEREPNRRDPKLVKEAYRLFLQAGNPPSRQAQEQLLAEINRSNSRSWGIQTSLSEQYRERAETPAEALDADELAKHDATFISSRGLPKATLAAEIDEQERQKKVLSKYRSARNQALSVALWKNPKATLLEVCVALDDSGGFRSNHPDGSWVHEYQDRKLRPSLEATFSKMRRELFRKTDLTLRQINTL